MRKRWAIFLLLFVLIAGRGAAETAVTTLGGTANKVPVFAGTATFGNSVITQLNGNVEIGTTTPGALLNVGLMRNSTQAYGSYRALFISNPTQRREPTAEIKVSPADPGCAGCTNIAEKITVSDSAGSAKTNYGLWVDSNSAATNYAIYANSGIGYCAGKAGADTSPSATLEVDGNLKLTSGSDAPITFADGIVQSTAYTGVTSGGDYADSVDVSGEPKRYEPMATVGIVPTKVSAENGPIYRGDLLVSASLTGYGMKGTDRNRMVGAVAGKAMGSLDSGTGVIEVLISLQ